jgi:hypothetical protein
MRMTNSVLPNGRVTHRSSRPHSSYAPRPSPLPLTLSRSLAFCLVLPFSVPPWRHLAINCEVLEGGLLIRAHCFHCPETYDAIDGLEGKKEEATEEVKRIGGRGRCGF